MCSAENIQEILIRILQRIRAYLPQPLSITLTTTIAKVYACKVAQYLKTITKLKAIWQNETITKQLVDNSMFKKT